VNGRTRATASAIWFESALKTSVSAVEIVIVCS
jgi:hypothetical protein